MSPLGETGQSVQGISVLFFKIACGPTVISVKFSIRKPKQPNLLKVRTRGCKPRWVNSKAHPQPLSLHTDDVGSLNNTSRSDTSWFTIPAIPSATASCLALMPSSSSNLYVHSCFCSLLWLLSLLSISSLHLSKFFNSFYLMSQILSWPPHHDSAVSLFSI